MSESSPLLSGSSAVSTTSVNTRGKFGPQRTSFTNQKLKILPQGPETFEDDEQETPAEVYSQLRQITDSVARKDAERLGKAHRKLLPRVTAYCTAGSYRMNELNRYLSGRTANHAEPKLIDECLYTPYTYLRPGEEPTTGPTRLTDEGGEIDTSYRRSDLFIFQYGVVVMWGFRQDEEQRVLQELARFEREKLAYEDVHVEEFNYYITQSYQPRIYNDFFALRDHNYMTKLSISHAIAQSAKISLFEELVDNTISDTQDFPLEIAETGKIDMSRRDIMKSIGELFILRVNVNLHGSVLDSPELMWAEPQLEPIYQATRGYLEISQRVQLLNTRLEVVNDLLQMLKEQLGQVHGEYLEIIVIVLIAAEIVVALINVIVDVYAQE
ncbi:Sporulation protein RMD1 [Wickerhamiella sorbophila]|uniref:Sporulation protein RMD1 n=1 Tax=Wickerhamiella sorbophila TaxID=45607 RepID=A0A2T0FG54_9ASCO|nr:Sporulation protein RMD1 [Wickerhamiella sorbophila]PRT53982.1 Sporulation protein RMD1 [Wickerhamiella sorbophila]